MSGDAVQRWALHPRLGWLPLNEYEAVSPLIRPERVVVLAADHEAALAAAREDVLEQVLATMGECGAEPVLAAAVILACRDRWPDIDGEALAALRKPTGSES